MTNLKKRLTLRPTTPSQRMAIKKKIAAAVSIPAEAKKNFFGSR